MLRLASMLFFAVLAVLPLTPGAFAQDSWSQIATAEIDPRAAGSRVIVVSPGEDPVAALRLAASDAVEIKEIIVTTADPKEIGRSGPLKLTADKPGEIWRSAATRTIKSVEIKWGAKAGSAAKVWIVVEGDPTVIAKTAAVPAEPRSVGDAAPRAPASRGPVVSAPAPSAPTPSSSAPSAGAPVPKGVAPAPSQGTGTRSVTRSSERESAAAGPAPANACTERNACTIVDVFFGTTRNQVAKANHISFGSKQPGSLTLGHTFVTVPRVNREKGAVPLPTLWQRVMGVPPEGDPNLHFTIPRGGVKVYASEESFLADAKRHIASPGNAKDHAFIYVHGFSVTFEAAMYRAAQISYDLGEGSPFGTAFVYTWPSKGSVLPTAYNYDQDSADNSISQLVEFIRLVSDKTGVANVHIIAHSMGNRVLMRTLDEIARFSAGSRARINQVVLAAPDVDKVQFEAMAKNIVNSKVAKGLTLYASQADTALQISRKARGDGAPPRAGDVAPPAGPAIVPGIDTIDISALSTSVFDLGHDKYADSPELLADIRKLFNDGGKPSERSSSFRITPWGTLQYWRYVRDQPR